MRLFQEGTQVRDSAKKAGREGEKADSLGHRPALSHSSHPRL